MTYLSADNISGDSYRYFVELASNETELDAWGEPVPVSFKTLDVVVAEPGIDAVVGLLVQQDWLNGYTVCDYWQPEDECPF